MNPLVSIVIPNYNHGRFLDQAIQSALDQSYAPLEVVVVDDGSTDDSMSVLRRYEKRVRWFAQARRGVSGARNRGIVEAAGEFVAFLDADDYWRKDKLACQMPLFDRREVGLVYCGVDYVDCEGRLLLTDLRGRSGRILREFALFEVGLPGGSTPIVRRECFAAVGVFDEGLVVSEDWDMGRRIFSAFEAAFVRQALVSYRQHPENHHHDVDRLRLNMHRALTRMFRDPAAREVWPLQRQVYGRLHLALAGSYAHNRRWAAAVREGAMAVWTWPPAVLAIGRRLLLPGREVSVERQMSSAARPSFTERSHEVDEAVFDTPKPGNRRHEDDHGDGSRHGE